MEDVARVPLKVGDIVVAPWRATLAFYEVIEIIDNDRIDARRVFPKQSSERDKLFKVFRSSSIMRVDESVLTYIMLKG